MGKRVFGTIRRLPSGRWQARYSDPNGRQVAAPTVFPTKAAAARWLSTIEADIVRGHYRDPRTGDVTFAEWVERWLSSNPAKRPTTLARDRVVLEKHFMPALGPMRLSTITPLDVQGAVAAMAERVKPNTSRTNVAVLRAALNAAVDVDLIVRSPARGIKGASADTKERAVLSAGDVERLAAEVAPRYRCVILVAAVLGCASRRLSAFSSTTSTFTDARSPSAAPSRRSMVARSRPMQRPELGGACWPYPRSSSTSSPTTSNAFDRRQRPATRCSLAPKEAGCGEHSPPGISTLRSAGWASIRCSTSTGCVTWRPVCWWTATLTLGRSWRGSGTPRHACPWSSTPTPQPNSTARSPTGWTPRSSLRRVDSRIEATDRAYHP
jgi:Phage integrase, N-terminal SAM-like domain